MKPSLLVSLALASLIAGSATSAHARRARGPERVFKGKIIILGRRPPIRFRSAGHFIRFLKSNRKKHIWPDKKTKKKWKLEFMAFFRRPLNDFEAKLTFYDVTERRRFIAGDSIYMDRKGQRVLSSNIVLEKPRFEVNRRYVMYVTDSRGRVLASTKFWLRGKAVQYSGKVTFSDDEAKLK